MQRFEREAQATALMRSAHTVELYDFGVTEDGTFYYVMELLDGLDLSQLVRRGGPVPAERAVHFLRQVCDSLAEAHEAGLIHRDIKPANVYACRYGRKLDFVKVLDFGLVKHGGSRDDGAEHADRGPRSPAARRRSCRRSRRSATRTSTAGATCTPSGAWPTGSSPGRWCSRADRDGDHRDAREPRARSALGPDRAADPAGARGHRPRLPREAPRGETANRRRAHGAAGRRLRWRRRGRRAGRGSGGTSGPRRSERRTLLDEESVRSTAALEGEAPVSSR